jgi:Protein of unknown function (DUF3040)
MSLPARQQAILDQTEKRLQAADPRLTSMFAAFTRLAELQGRPATSGTRPRSARRTVLICCVLLGVLGGALMLTAVATRNACPGLSSDQVVASAAVRYAGCGKNTDAWSRGAR